MLCACNKWLLAHPESSEAARRRAACRGKGNRSVRRSNITVENEADALKALDDVKAHGVNALVVFLGNFGPETPETILCPEV